MVPAFAEPDIHSLSQALADRHRRLSVCSLPVLKQFGESLGSFDVRRSVGNRRTWQSARCVILSFFRPEGRGFYAATLWESGKGTKSRRPRSTASRYATIFRATASVARLAFPSAFLFHRPAREHDLVWAPVSRLPPVPAGYVCCAVWKAGCASLCQRSSFHRRRARSN